MRFSIPMPPSANRLWRVMRGRPVKGPLYREWTTHAIAAMPAPPVPFAWFSVSLVLPETRRDPDNAIKPILDAMQRARVIQDDRMLRGLTLDIDTLEDGRAIIEVFQAPPPAAVAEKDGRARMAINCAALLLMRDDLRPHARLRAQKVAATTPDALPVPTVEAMFRLYRDVTGGAPA